MKRLKLEDCNMAVETILPVLESVLLVATIIILLYSIREGKGRKNRIPSKLFGNIP